MAWEESQRSEHWLGGKLPRNEHRLPRSNIGLSEHRLGEKTEEQHWLGEKLPTSEHWLGGKSPRSEHRLDVKDKRGLVRNRQCANMELVGNYQGANHGLGGIAKERTLAWWEITKARTPTAEEQHWVETSPRSEHRPGEKTEEQHWLGEKLPKNEHWLGGKSPRSEHVTSTG